MREKTIAKQVPCGDDIADSIPNKPKQSDKQEILGKHTTTSCPFLFLSKNRYDIVQKNWHKYRAAGRISEWKNRNMANNVLRDFKVRVRDAGIMATGKVTIHCLRKSWASNLANAGVPSNTLMRMGGWSNIETVLKYYLKSSDENEKRAVRILDRLMGVEVGSGFVGKEG
jgi:integrase